MQMTAKSFGEVRNAIDEAEDVLNDLLGWSLALIAIGGCQNPVDPHGITMIGLAIKEQLALMNDLRLEAHAALGTATVARQ